ncbi:MAG: DNA-directed RNA polymerase subunit D [Nanoarchaeota archaeon]|nr:DNA-directed RNA polymerase subunit D [Nanoarchaeota archaeon]
MELTIIKKEDNKLIFTLDKINPTIANTIRRATMFETPCLAIDTVTFKKNDSALYDEILAHRLGFVPIKTDLKSFNTKDTCKCKGEGCALCELKFTLKAQGPSVIYASELKSKDPKCIPVYPEMPIVNLLPNKKLELEATATFDIGKNHTKFSPCLTYYRTYPKINLNNYNDQAAFDVCPKKVFKFDKKLEIANLENCDLCNSCVEISNNKIEIIPSREKFIFFLESWGQLTPKEILTKSMSILNDKLDEFQKKFKKAKSV